MSGQDERKQVIVRVAEEFARAVDEEAARRGQNRTEFTIEAWRRMLAEGGRSVRVPVRRRKPAIARLPAPAEHPRLELLTRRNQHGRGMPRSQAVREARRELGLPV